MPLPKPNPNEEKKDFVMRCMANDTMVKEFPETDQRLAVCSSTYEESKLKKDKKNEQNNASPSLLKHETKYANKRLD